MAIEDENWTALHRLTYASRATPEVRRNLGPVLRDVLDVSARNNAAASVTGALLAMNGWFVQTLEGPRRQVTETFDRVSNDRRHTEVHIIRATPVDKRLFGAWSMCGAELSARDRAVSELLSHKLPSDMSRLTEPMALTLLGLVARLTGPSRPADDEGDTLLV